MTSNSTDTQVTTRDKRTYTVEEIADILGISMRVAYALVHSGQFRSVRVGKCIRVSKSSFDIWLNPEQS